MTEIRTIILIKSFLKNCFFCLKICENSKEEEEVQLSFSEFTCCHRLSLTCFMANISEIAARLSMSFMTFHTEETLLKVL